MRKESHGVPSDVMSRIEADMRAFRSARDIDSFLGMIVPDDDEVDGEARDPHFREALCAETTQEFMDAVKKQRVANKSRVKRREKTARARMFAEEPNRKVYCSKLRRRFPDIGRVVARLFRATRPTK